MGAKRKGEFDSYEDVMLDENCLTPESNERIFTVRSDSTHDLCCAEFGNKIYSELLANTESVWQISHLAGCRLAPNVVCLPDGIVYGRVDPADCAAIVRSYQDWCLRQNCEDGVVIHSPCRRRNGCCEAPKG